MRIAIIGAGNIGRSVARAAINGGHQIVIAAEHAEKARDVANDVGGSAAADNAEAVRDADVVILAVPYNSVAGVAAETRDAVADSVVVDATNPLNQDMSGLAVSDRSAAEELQAQLPEAPVVKAFNTVFAANQASPVVDGMPLDGFYAGDDEEAKAKVAELLRTLGYRPIDVGPLASSRALEHMAFLNISMNARNGWSWQSGWKLVGPTGTV
jgi:NADPH-dependent F420 reductase